HRQSGERACGEDQPVVGMIPVRFRTDLVVEDLGAEPDPTEVFPHVVGTPRLRPRLAGREVHAQELAGVAPRPAAGGGGRLLLGTRDRRGRAHFITTDWGS